MHPLGIRQGLSVWLARFGTLFGGFGIRVGHPAGGDLDDSFPWHCC